MRWRCSRHSPAGAGVNALAQRIEQHAIQETRTGRAISTQTACSLDGKRNPTDVGGKGTCVSGTRNDALGSPRILLIGNRL
eukprot:7462086-Pyramimonas_sp.AAC.1